MHDLTTVNRHHKYVETIILECNARSSPFQATEAADVIMAPDLVIWLSGYLVTVGRRR